MKIQSLDIIVNFYEEDDHILLNEDGSMNKELMFSEAAKWLKAHLKDAAEDIQDWKNMEESMEIEDPGDMLNVFVSYHPSEEWEG